MSSAAWTALVAVYFVWGSTYLAIRYAIESIPPSPPPASASPSPA
ncbi:hypothetical protein ACFQ9X_51160 [Catenulispora yoronensis]